MPKGVYKRTEEHKRNIGKSVRKPRETRTCAAPGCNNTFECIVTSERKYCSPGGCCRKGKPGWSKGLTKETHPSLAAASEKKIGKKQSKETIDKRSKKLKGKVYVELHGEEKAKEILRKKSETLKNTLLEKPRPCGELNSNWQGGISKLPYSFEFNEEFKTLTRERDNNTCQLCGKTKEQEGRNLCVHHISYDKENNCSNEDNFITLCTSCNAKVNVNRGYWEKFFKDMLQESTLIL